MRAWPSFGTEGCVWHPHLRDPAWGGGMRPHVWGWVPRVLASSPSPPAPRDALKPCFPLCCFFFFNGEIIIYSLISSCFYGNSMAALGGEVKTSRGNGNARKGEERGAPLQGCSNPAAFAKAFPRPHATYPRPGRRESPLGTDGASAGEGLPNPLAMGARGHRPAAGRATAPYVGHARMCIVTSLGWLQRAGARPRRYRTRVWLGNRFAFIHGERRARAVRPGGPGGTPLPGAGAGAHAERARQRQRPSPPNSR